MTRRLWPKRQAWLPALFFCVACAWSLPAQPALAAAENGPEAACRFADDAPELHVVVRGDTLWDLASRFLRDPWCWPRVWKDNRATVANPHLIYPGQQIRLDRALGLLSSAPADAPALPVVRLAPAVRAEAIAAAPLPLIASSWLALAQKTPLMSMAELAQAPRIVALSGERRMAGAGDLIYVRSKPGSTQSLPLSAELRRPLAPVIDPDTGKPIALATRRIGRADWLRGTPDGLQTMQVTEASEELMAGDLLVGMPSRPVSRSGPVPHAAVALQGRVAALLHDRRWATVHDIVALNRGAQHGLDAGSVVSVVQPVRIRSHESPSGFSTASAISEPVATLLVVDVLEHAALAIVMRAQEPLSAGATVISPDGAGK